MVNGSIEGGKPAGSGRLRKTLIRRFSSQGEEEMKRRRLAGFLAVLLASAIAQAAPGAQEVSGEDHHARISPENVHRFDPQQVEVEDFEAEGYILAIGGGGEGVIGRLKGEQVIAIDISRRELEEAPGDALKIVMDAREMSFLDGSFSTAASFFTLMYIDGSDHPAVFGEVYRVLAPGGRFLIWDAVFGPPPEEGATYGVVPMEVKLPRTLISTGYGVRWPERPHDPAYYERLAEAAGFVITAKRVKDRWFHLELRKP
jgi:SAM-dependent methyltransferase